jgi:hypothetical protein
MSCTIDREALCLVIPSLFVEDSLLSFRVELRVFRRKSSEKNVS